jgi:hypothetical protein
LAPEFQDRIRAANSLEKAGFMQFVQGTWEKDGATLSAGITDYKVAHEQFQLIKDDMLGVKHAPPQL